MRSYITGLATVTALAASLTIGGRAEAAAAPAPEGLRVAVDTLALTDTVQFYWGGREYCWYDDGWQGGGYYWCGYQWRRGFGWGGGGGWHGWGHGGRGGGRDGRGGRGRGGGRDGRGGRGRGGGGGGMGGGGMGGGMGGGGGGGMGGGGMMSDIRAKHDIVLLGKLANGLGFYRFSYNGSDKAYVGVMAQEVENVMPDAVTLGNDGYLRVYYDKLGVQMQSWEDWVASGQTLPAVNTSVRH